MFPNFIIAGAPKCGTTTLSYHLGQHPDILLSQPKEPRIFSMNWKGADLEHYKNYFLLYNSEKAIGEASGSYFSNKDVPKRIYQVYPNMKVIFIFRNPLEQLLSYYWQRVRHGYELRPWHLAIKSDTSDSLFQFSFYYQNLSYFLKYIPIENIHIVIFEDFKKNRNHELQKIFSFLEIDPLFKTKDEIWENEGTATKSLRLSFFIKKIRSSKHLNHLLPNSLKPYAKSAREFLESINSTKMKKAMNENEIVYLKNLFYNDVKNLEHHLGKKLPWGI